MTGKNWQSASRRRLRIALAIATAIVLLILMLPLRLEPPPASPDELTVTVVRQETPDQASVPEPVPEPEVRPVEEPESAQPEATVAEAPSDAEDDSPPMPAAEQTPDPPAAEPATPPTRDWYALLETTAARVVGESAATPSMSPDFDAARREAEVRFAPARAGAPPPIWENVEKDLLGRTILVAGDCHRVLDDPNVGNRYQFETFTQYLVFCNSGRTPPKKLAFVADIRERYDYLGDPAIAD